MRLLLAGVGLLLAGCVPKLVWTKPGASHQDFLTDKYECKQESKTIVTYERGRRNTSRNEVDPEFYGDCMRAHGWRHVEERGEDPTPPSPRPAANAPQIGGANWGFTGDACGPAVPCKGTRECVEGRCSELR